MAAEAQFAREGAAVVGACFALMGSALAGRARRHADDHIVWQRRHRQALDAAPVDAAAEERERRRTAFLYRAAGAAFAGGGLLLLGAALFAFDALAAWQRPPALGRGGALGCGLLLSVAGFSLAWSKASRLERAPAAGPGPAPLGERLASACGWALSFLLSGYGLRLLREALR